MGATTIGTPGAQANDTRLAYDQEDTWGEVPGSPDMSSMRYTNETFKQETETFRSDEIEGSRQTTDFGRINLRARGDLNGRLSFGTWDPFFESVLYAPDISGIYSGAERAVATADTTVLADETAGVYTITTGATWTNTPALGNFIEISGFTGSASNNGFALVVAASSTVITVTHKVLVDDAAGEAVTITEAPYWRNGSTFRSFVFERNYSPTILTNKFARFLGMTPGTFELGVSVNEMLSVRCGFLGKNETSASSAIDASVTAVNTNRILEAVDHVTAVFQNGVSKTVTGVSLRIDNNLRERLAVGVQGATSIGLGEIAVNGDFTSIYQDETEFDRYLNFTGSQAAFIIDDDSAGAGTYCVHMPNTRYSDASRSVAGKNTDVEQPMSYEAFRGTVGHTIHISRFNN